MVANVKFILALFTILYSFSFVLAQDEPTDPEQPAPTGDTPPTSGEPPISPCVGGCATEAAGAASCQLEDPACWCTNETFRTTVLACLQTNCPEEITDAQAVNDALCASVPAPSGEPSGDPESGVPSSTPEPSGEPSIGASGSPTSSPVATTSPRASTTPTRPPSNTQNNQSPSGTGGSQGSNSPSAASAVFTPFIGTSGMMAALTFGLAVAAGWIIL